jgi:hypothetical protein
MVPPAPAVVPYGYVYPNIGSVFPSSTEDLTAPAYYTQMPLPGQYHGLRPLAPAFDWENHVTETELAYPTDETVSGNNIPQIFGGDYPEVVSIYPLLFSRPLMTFSDRFHSSIILSAIFIWTF